MTTELPEGTHPSEVLLEDFMQATNIPARQLAADIDGSPSRISDIVNARRPISADTAVRLGLFFGVAARFWVNLQAEYGMRIGSRALQQGAAQRIRPFGCNFSRAQNPAGAPGPPLPHPPEAPPR